MNEPQSRSVRCVVALTSQARRSPGAAEELARILDEMDEVEILEGRGRNSVTVKVPSRLIAVLKDRLPLASVETYQELDLLAK